jgi:hypothetical protein
MRRSHTPLLVGLVALLFSSVVATRALADADWNPTLFTAFGEKAFPTREYAEERLDDVFLRPEQGHDGKFYFVQANDPWLLDPEENASVLDRPLYRSQRMLYPVLAGVGGLLGPQAIVWSMLIVNLMALGVGSWVVARIATEMGISAWWGLAFGLNIGFISEINIGGAGVVAAACAFGAVLCAMRHKVLAAAVLLTLAALTREAMLIAALGTALWIWWREERRDAVAPLVVPVFAVIGWAVYVRMRIGSPGVSPKVEEIGWPFVGLIEAFRNWLTDPFDLLAGLAIVFVILLFARRVITTPHVVGWAFAGFALLAVLFTEQVWHSFFDITRAVAPIITSFVLLVFVVSRHEPERVSGSRTMSVP